MIAKYRIVIGGMFEPISHELRQSGIVEVERSSAAHIFFRVSGDMVGLARPTDDGWAVEVLLTDSTGGIAAQRLADQIQALLQDYAVGGPFEQRLPEPTS